MKSLIFIFTFSFLSCETKDVEVKDQPSDIIILKSNQHIDELHESIKSVDSQVADKVSIVVERIEVLQKENEKLRRKCERLEKAKKVTDTIYIIK